MQRWLYEELSIVGTIDPANNNNASFNTDIIDMSKWSEVMFLLVLGAVDNTLDFKVQESNDGAGFTGAADLSGKAITQFAATDDNKQAIVCVKAEELTPSRRYIRGRLTVGAGTTNLCTVIALGKAVY